MFHALCTCNLTEVVLCVPCSALHLNLWCVVYSPCWCINGCCLHKLYCMGRECKQLLLLLLSESMLCDDWGREGRTM